MTPKPKPRKRKATTALESPSEAAGVPAVVAAEPENNAMPEGKQSRTISEEDMLLLEEHVYAQERMLSTILKGFDIGETEKKELKEVISENSQRIRNIMTDQRLHLSVLPLCQVVRQATTKKCITCMVYYRGLGQGTSSRNLPKGNNECTTCSAWLDIPFTICGNCVNDHYTVFLRVEVARALHAIINEHRLEAGKQPIRYFHVPAKTEAPRNCSAESSEDSDAGETKETTL
jgi:hypothetical protein